MPELFTHWYNWSDHEVFASYLERFLPEAPVVFELASGPNIVTPYLLERTGKAYRYIACELEPYHLKLQLEGVADARVLGTISDGMHLPLQSACADMAVFHHAIDDLYETRGKAGLARSLAEAWRVLKPSGYAVFSHCEFPGDPATLEVNLDLVKLLASETGFKYLERKQAQAQEWLIVQKSEGA